jgi:hypothetical protein
MKLTPELAWGRGLETWLRIYSDFVCLRVAAEEGNRDFFVIDLLAFLIGAALEEEYPAVDAIALLRAQVRADSETPIAPERLAQHEGIRKVFDRYHQDLHQGKRPWRAVMDTDPLAPDAVTAFSKEPNNE